MAVVFPWGDRGPGTRVSVLEAKAESGTTRFGDIALSSALPSDSFRMSHSFARCVEAANWGLLTVASSNLAARIGRLMVADPM